MSEDLEERYSSRLSAGTRDHSCTDYQCQPALSICINLDYHCMVFVSLGGRPRLSTHLVKIDDRLPKVVRLSVEVSHSNLSEVTRVVFVHVGSVMMLATGETPTTGVLSVFANATVTGGDVAAAVMKLALASLLREGVDE